jgi:hypothetical protein
MNPKRIQRSRAKGWRMPEGAIYVGRPTMWGNPFRIGERFYVAGPIGPTEWLDSSREGVVKAFRAWTWEHIDYWAAITRCLRGKDLACWCRLDQPCHADVLLELANR